MNTSTIVKILLALFLAAFLWLVITNIQAPVRETPQETPQQQLRDELLSIAENVTINIGDVAIEAQIQESYRNGEIHYQHFKMVQEKENRTVTITGRTAQTKSQGTQVDYFVFIGNIVVDTTDGLHLETESLNYESNNDRLFTQEVSNFVLNELTGRCNKFAYFFKTNKLDMQGQVVADYFMEPEEESAAKRRINIRGRRVIFDQTEHALNIYDKARISEGGSFIKGTSIETELNQDNNQFVRMRVEKAISRALPDFGSDTTPEPEPTQNDEQVGEDLEEEEPQGDANLSHHASGIKDIEANTLLLGFTTGETNLLRTVTAQGNAVMEITPAGPELQNKNAEFKRISGEQISALVDTESGGVKSINVISEKGLSRLFQRPLGRPAKSNDNVEDRSKLPRTTKAKTINMTIDSSTNNLTSMNLNQNMSLVQGDLNVTSASSTYQAATESMTLTGNPVFKDEVKRVSGDSMTINMIIDDLAATGNVSSQFYRVEPKPGEEARSVFAIGKEGGETLINANSLRLDYSNNVLRYREGVTINQGNTAIKSEKLDIYQIEEKLIAIGGVTADLTFENIESARSEKSATETKSEGASATKQNKGIFLSGEYLEINKTERFVRVRTNARAVQSSMTLSAEEIGYVLDEEDRIIRSEARRKVVIDIGGPLISGDTATIEPDKEILIVEGRLVTYSDPDGLSGGNYRKIEFDMNTRAMRFFGQGSAPIQTKVLGQDAETP
jgi:lipopolysaccharide export system protein LptA